MKKYARIAILGLGLYLITGCDNGGLPGQPDYDDIVDSEIIEITGRQANPFPPADEDEDDNNGGGSPTPPPWDPFPPSNPGDGGSGGGSDGPNFPTPDFPEESDGNTNPTNPSDPWGGSGGTGWPGGSSWGTGWGGGFGGYGTIPGIQELVSVGTLVFNLIEKNQPQVAANTNRISILPNAPEDWENLEGWTGPHVRTFVLKLKNYLGQTVTSFQYKIIYYANGNLNGRGKYIANLQVVPEIVDIGWGRKFDCRFEVADIINAGTKDSPIVGAHFQLQWRHHSWSKRVQGIDSYYLKGDSDLLVIR